MLPLLEIMLPALDQDEVCGSGILIGHYEPMDKRIDNDDTCQVTERFLMLWAMHFDRACDVEQDRSAGSRNKRDLPQLTRTCLALRMTACILMEFERYSHSWRFILVYNNEPYAAHSSSTLRLLVDYSENPCEHLGADIARGSQALA